MALLPTHNDPTPSSQTAPTNIRPSLSRFLHPPNVSHVPRGRSYRVKPHFKVTLDDILSNKHLPPLSATDFENFLTYVEYEQGSVQNLYFLLWLHQYTEQYNEWKAKLPALSSSPRSTTSSSTSTSMPTQVQSLPLTGNPSTDPTGRPRTSARTLPSKPLAYSWYRARRTFFLEYFADGGPLSTATNPVYKSHLRLKIHPELLRPFIADAPHGMLYDDRFPRTLGDDIDNKRGPTYITGAKGSGLVHPAPERFTLIRAEAERRLNDSLKRFIDVSFTNTGNYRGLFGTAMALINILAAILLLLAIGFWKWSRCYFILTWFLLWMGSWGTLVTMNGICFCVFLFGSRQWFPYEIEQCNHPRPSPSADGQDLTEIIKTSDLCPLSHSPDEASEATTFHQLEKHKQAHEQKEEVERCNGLAEARARIMSEGWGPSGSNMVPDKEYVAQSRPQPLHSETDSIDSRSVPPDDAIFISEAYSEGFSPPSSPIQVSMTTSSVADLSEQTQHENPELHQRTESLIEVNSACDVPASSAHLPVSHRHYQPPYPIPLGPCSAQSDFACTDDAPWPSKPQSVSVSEGQTEPKVPQQLIPHDHEQLKSSHTNLQRRIPLYITSPSTPARTHQHRKRRTPGATQAAEHDVSKRLRFDFDQLPKEPPPLDLTGDRRAIAFMAPMTSIQHCPLIVRMHWLVVVRSILFGTVISIVLEAVCISAILGTQM